MPGPFKLSPCLLKKWSPTEDKLINQLYDKHGPAWNVIASKMAGRKTYECLFHYHYRLHPLDLGALRKREEELVNNGYEKYGNQWVDYDLPEIGPKNYSILAKEFKEDVKENRLSGKKLRRRGWRSDEAMVMRECLEYLGPNWEFLSNHLKGRSSKVLCSIYKKQFMSEMINDYMNDKKMAKLEKDCLKLHESSLLIKKEEA